MSTRVDLSRLAVTREAPASVAPSAGGRRSIVARVLLPGLLLAGFAGLVAYAARDALSPPRAVTVMPVTASTAALDAPADTPLFRAAGWAEPRPTPTVVTALAEGVVDQLLVVEGQEVKAGQVVARLIDTDAKIALEAAEADVELRDSEAASARAALAAARGRYEVPVHLRAELADAESALAKAESDLAVLPNAMAAAAARYDYARRDLAGSRSAGDAVARLAVDKAVSDANAASAVLKELQAREKRLPVEIAALKAKRDAQKSKLDRLIDEVRQVAEGEAAVKAAAARMRQAKAARDAAKLRLDRMDVRAAAGGKVLSLVARPGHRLNGLAATSLQDSSTVLTTYDPARMQVRVDVRLDDVAKVRPGQKVRIESAALPEKHLAGVVLLATSQADIQKNTLSVKVAVDDPPAALRPEMLCQVTFLAPPRPAGGKEAGKEPYRLLVPKSLIDGDAVWVADQLAGVARRRTVETGASMGELVEIVSGLSAQDKLVVAGREGLRDGERVRVAGEDETLGVGAMTR